MGLAIVQRTGRVSAASSTFLALTFATPPAVGNAIVVLSSVYDTAGSLTTCVDNHANAYLKARDHSAGFVRTTIHYCPVVTVSAAPFTVTLALVGNLGYYEAAAIEVSGVGTGLVLDKVASQNTNTTTPTTGATAALTADEELLVAVLTASANQTAITVQTVSPPWTQEYENLNYSATVAGEGDTRIVTGATGTTPSASWTINTVGGQGVPAVLAAFKAGVSGAALAASATLAVSTTAVLTTPAGAALAGNTTVVLSATAALTTPAIAHLTATATLAFSSTAATLTSPVAAAAVSQLVIETLNPLARAPIAATQLVAEQLDRNPNAALVTQLLCELLVIGQAHECLASSTPLPIDPD